MILRLILSFCCSVIWKWNFTQSRCSIFSQNVICTNCHSCLDKLLTINLMCCHPGNNLKKVFLIFFCDLICTNCHSCLDKLLTINLMCCHPGNNFLKVFLIFFCDLICTNYHSWLDKLALQLNFLHGIICEDGTTFKTHRFWVNRYKAKHYKIFSVIPQFCLFNSWFWYSYNWS